MHTDRLTGHMQQQVSVKYLRVARLQSRQGKVRVSAYCVAVRAQQDDGRLLATNGYVHQVAMQVHHVHLGTKAVQNDVDGPVGEQHRVGLLVHLLKTSNTTKHNTIPVYPQIVPDCRPVYRATTAKCAEIESSRIKC
jgi:hypothetical protein